MAERLGTTALGLSVSHSLRPGFAEDSPAPPLCFQHALSSPAWNTGAQSVLPEPHKVHEGWDYAREWDWDYTTYVHEGSLGYHDLPTTQRRLSSEMLPEYWWLTGYPVAGLGRLFSGGAMPSIGRSLGALQTRMSQGRIFLTPNRRISCLSFAGLVSLPESPSSACQALSKILFPGQQAWHTTLFDMTLSIGSHLRGFPKRNSPPPHPHQKWGLVNVPPKP